MSILVLALGVLLAIGGCLSVYFGYGIIEVERGWTGVIAGATALAGGVVTIALGLILRSLQNLRVAIENARQASPQAPQDVRYDRTPAMPIEPSIEPGLAESRPWVPAPGLRTEPVHTEPLYTQPVHTAPMHDTEEVAAAAAESVAIEEPPQSRPEPRPTPDIAVAGPTEPPRHYEELTRHHEEPVQHHEEPAPEPVPAARPAAEPRPSIEEMWRLVDEELEKTDWAKEIQRSTAAPQPPLGGAEWRDGDHPDRAHDHDEPPQEHPVETHAEETHGYETHGHETEAHETHEHEQEPYHGEEPAYHAAAPEPEVRPHTPAAAEPHHETPAERAPEHPAVKPEEAVVIGRYQADGTSYTMFADGSIEAQSESGVFRFSSMAELKAFIEQEDKA